jgi:solute carrier family 25 citrate transporter 1
MSTSTPSNQLDKLLAGAAAGLLESLTTYPTEYVKTRQQLPRSTGKPQPMTAILAQTLRNGKTVQTLYSGASSFCLSNAAKSGVRFFTFDKARSYMARDPQTGKWSPTSNLQAGLLAGTAEGILVVTPGETLKTRIIEDRLKPKHEQFRGVIDAIRHIFRTDGPTGLYRGLVPVTLKQSSNAMVRFTSYNAILGFLDGAFKNNQDSIKPVLAGASAGMVTVYATMPFDSVKTRLQASGNRNSSSGTLACVARMIREEGILSLWRGTTPRLIRLTVSHL